MDKITILLTTEEVNGVLTALSERPFREVSGLIQNIVSQAQPQFEASQPINPEQ